MVCYYGLFALLFVVHKFPQSQSRQELLTLESVRQTTTLPFINAWQSLRFPYCSGQMSVEGVCLSE